MLLVLGLFVTILAFAVLSTAPRVAQQLQRDREEEMIHRGAQYARAIRNFVKKNGTYPTSLEQLEDTNRVRYIRRLYKDPFAEDGKWRPLRIGDVPFMAGRQAGQQFGQPTGQLGQPSGGRGGIGQQLGQPLGGQLGGIGQSIGQPIGGQLGAVGQQIGAGGLNPGGQGLGLGGGAFGQGSQPQGLGQSGPQGGRGTGPGGLTSQASSSQSGPTFGGGAIIGVASVSEKDGLKEFNEKSKYKEWYFVYDPIMDASNPNGSGALIVGPYTGKTFQGNSSSGIGTPAGQLASPNQPNGFGQPIGSGPAGTSGFGGANNPAVGAPARR